MGDFIQRMSEFSGQGEQDGHPDLLNLAPNHYGPIKTIDRCLLIRGKVDQRFICRFWERIELCFWEIEVLRPSGLYVHVAPYPDLRRKTLTGTLQICPGRQHFQRTAPGLRRSLIHGPTSIWLLVASKAQKDGLTKLIVAVQSASLTWTTRTGSIALAASISVSGALRNSNPPNLTASFQTLASNVAAFVTPEEGRVEQERRSP
jgi:hypothetical protein